MGYPKNYQNESPYNKDIERLSKIFNVKIKSYYVMKRAIGITFEFRRDWFSLGLGGDKTDILFNRFLEIEKIDFKNKTISTSTSKIKLNELYCYLERYKERTGIDLVNEKKHEFNRL